MSKTLSNEQLERIAEMFRLHLGRELTAAERKYLGLSSTVTPLDDSTKHENKPTEGKRAKAS